MSAVSKGNEIEKRAQRAQERDGYVTERAKRTFVMIKKGVFISRHVDLFGTFDLTAIHPSRPTLHTQVSVPAHRAEKRDKVDVFLAKRPELIGSDYHSFQVWIWGRWDDLGYGFKREGRGPGGWEGLEFVPSSATRRA